MSGLGYNPASDRPYVLPRISMLLDSRELAPDQDLEGDVCVVGAGAAGITLARELIRGRRGVVLLEGGGETYEQESQLLYEGSESGPLIGPESGYLTSSRLRYFGGSTNHWHGWCRPLDAEDFEAREWVPESGWPLSREELDAWYERAAPLLEITPFDYDQTAVRSRPKLLDDDPDFEHGYFHLSPPTRFRAVYGGELATAEDVRLVLHANVTAVEVTENGRRVVGVEAARADGSRFRVRAPVVVLATGGIENARLLLLSDAVHPRGLGNEHDLVGRYFMDHPVVRLGDLALAHARRLPLQYDSGWVRERGHEIRAVLRPSRRGQESYRLLNSLLVLYTRGGLGETGEAVMSLARQTRELALETPSGGGVRLGSRARVEMVSEQTPNRDSRVRLDDTRDALGLRRVAVDWRLTDREVASIRGLAERLVRSLGLRHRGRVRLQVREREPWARARWSNHHMGTTRMDPDPKRGVVDRDSQVHEVDGLYVAGSSVFPTSGVSNPTYTILALTLRLAEHLRGRLG